MKQIRDSEIRLFGKKIALPENGRMIVQKVVTVEDENGGLWNENGIFGSDSDLCFDVKKVSKVEESDQFAEVEKEEVVEEVEEDDDDEEEKQESDKDCLAGCETNPEEKDQDSIGEVLENSKALLESDDSPNSSSMDEDSPNKESGNAENDQNDANNSQPKKKPDKILPCPRCNSMDTKFCYYNNYNVNQPRHFCKSCQRYWTAGGTMRNVPVGAGRRKNKNSSSHCRHITISEALQAARIDAPNGFHHPTFKPNGTVLSFGPDIPLCDSMTSVLNLTDKKVTNGTRNGFYKVDPGRPVSGKWAENGDDCSSGSSVTTSNSMIEGGKNGQQEPVMQHINGFHSPVPCLPGVPWPFPWNSAVPLPAICPSPFPMPFYPAPYWNCSMPGVAGVPGAWSIPWMPPVSPTASQKPAGSGPNSPTLGKHSRDGELLNKPKSPEGKESSERKNSESSVLVPKTLRIDDPDEAAKSSIWTTLGIKYDSISRGGLFKAFQPKSDKKEHMVTTSPVLQANPAALSRSVTFQETA